MGDIGHFDSNLGFYYAVTGIVGNCFYLLENKLYKVLYYKRSLVNCPNPVDYEAFSFELISALLKPEFGSYGFERP